MKSFRTTVLMMAAVLIASAALAQGSRGSGRLSGKVSDDAGKGIADVEVRAQKLGETQVLTTKTNDKGEWAHNGLASGQWNFDFVKGGLETVQRTTTISEGGRMPAMNITMKKAEAKADPNAELQKEVQRADQLIQANQYAEARKIYEGLLTKYPDVWQLNIFIARVYSAEGNNAKALEHARKSYEKDPQNLEVKMLMAFLLQASGEKEESTKILNSIDVTAVKDPLLFVNVAINYINEGKAAEAIELLNKLVTGFPNNPEILYYRGVAYLRGTKFDEARADFEKLVAANPSSVPKEVAEAKRMLVQIVTHFTSSNRAADALAIADKLVTQFPGEAILLYHRGRASLAASKWDAAKADFEKFVAANPPDAANEVAETKKLLEQLGKTKK